MLVIADIAGGPVFVFFGLWIGLIVLLLLSLIEAPVLWKHGWATWWMSLRDSLIMNTATTIVGIVLAVTTQDLLNNCGYDPERGGRWCEPLLPEWSIWLIMFVLTVAIEYGVLLLLRKEADKKLLLRIVAIANLITYALFIGLYLFPSS